MRGEVEAVQAAYAAWNARDLDRSMQLVHPDVEVVQDPVLPGAFSGTGREAMRRWVEGFYETWDDFQIDIERMIERGDRIVVVAHIRARGKSSGVEVDTRAGHLCTFRDGLILRFETFADPERALETAGQSE